MRELKILVILAISLLVVISTACQGSKPADSGQTGDKGTEVGKTVSDDTVTDTSTDDHEVDTAGETDDTADDDAAPITGSMETDDASFTIGENIPEGWPDHVPIMDGFKVKMGSTTTDKQTGEEGLTLTAVGRVSVEEVEKFYSNLSEWGEPEMSMNMGAGINLVLSRNDNEHLTVMAGHDEEGSEETSLRLVYVKE